MTKLLGMKQKLAPESMIASDDSGVDTNVPGVDKPILITAAGGEKKELLV